MSVPVPDDKVKINAYYDERDGSCHSIDVALNYDGVTARDVAEIVAALYVANGQGVTARHRELGSTDVVPRIHDTDNGTQIRPNGTGTINVSDARAKFNNPGHRRGHLP